MRMLLAAGTALLTTAAHGGLLDSIQSLPTNPGAGGLSGDASLGMPALNAVGLENVTGVLRYCIGQNYLRGDASGVADKLAAMLGGQRQVEASPDYQSGLQGLLGGKSAQRLDLNAGGLSGKLKDHVCKEVMQYGATLLR